MARNRAEIIAAMLLLLVPGVGLHPVAAEEKRQRPAEESRLDTRQFLNGLERRGLRELIELHLHDFPPDGAVNGMLLRRRLRLADYADESLSPEHRRRAITEANNILGQVIRDNPKDKRRFDWLFTLSHSLLYDEAEGFFTNILYRGGNAAERTALGALTERAVSAVSRLVTELEEEYDRVDKLSINEFAKLERSGYIDEIDQLGPKSQYLRLWSLFYDALPREEHDARRVRALHEIRDSLAGNFSLWESPHGASRIQVPALLLSGMVERRLHDHWSARSFFDRAISVADRLADSTQREDVDWAVTLASIERIRNNRDDGRFETALSGLDSFRNNVDPTDDGWFGLRVVAALLERSIRRAQAAAAGEGDRSIEVLRLRTQAWQPLAQLLKRHPDRRDEVYATLYSLIDPEADPARLDPLDQCALIAGVLAEVEQDGVVINSLLDRAVAAGEAFSAHAPPQAGDLRPEVLYNLAVVQFRRGLAGDAARRFLNLARDHPNFRNALQAAVWSVQITSRLYQAPELSDHPELGELYLDALDSLITRFPDTDAAHYWRFYFAQLLAEQGRMDRAAEQFALVDPAHEHYMDSRFLRLRAMARGLKGRFQDDPSDEREFRRLAKVFSAAQRAFVTDAAPPKKDPTVGGAGAAHLDEARQVGLRRFVARSILLAAEIQVLPPISRHAKALESLKGFEQEFPEDPVAIGRVWRVRLLAYEALGQFEEAASAIPSYVAADPESAGITLGTLYSGVVAELKELRDKEDQRPAQRKAEIALVLAHQLVLWNETHNTDADPAKSRAFLVQLAEANLRAGHFERARELFESLRSTDRGSPVLSEATDLRVVAGQAEAEFQLKQYEKALESFNVLAVRLPVNEPIRWQALLRDLQCRTALSHAPEGIIKVISQQRHLYPQLGGPAMAAQFDKLQRENQRRRDESRPQ